MTEKPNPSVIVIDLRQFGTEDRARILGALGCSTADYSADQPLIEVRETRVRLKKYEGDPPPPGEDKEPFEVIEWNAGDDPKVIFRRGGQPPESYAPLPYNEES